MEQPFYRERLATRFGLDVITPGAAERQQIHDVIYQELCVGRVVDSSRDAYRRIAAALVEQGAQGLIFGCTEIMMLLDASDVTVPAFDTTALHALAAVDRALA